MSQSDPVVDAEKTSHKASPRCWIALIVGTLLLIGSCYVPSMWRAAESTLFPSENSSDASLNNPACPISPREYEYFNDVSFITLSLNDLMAELQEVTDHAVAEPVSIYTVPWKDWLREVLVEFAADAIRLRALIPPASLGYIQAVVNILADNVDAMAMNFADGIDDLDMRKLQNVSAGITSIAERDDDVGLLMATYCLDALKSQTLPNQLSR